MKIRLLALCILAPLAIAVPILAMRPPVPPPTPEIRWSPDEPVQGTIFRLRVEPKDSAVFEAIEAEFAGEPLHFDAEESGAWSALAAIPIDASGTLPLALGLDYANGATDSARVDVPIAPGEYRHERLTVAPRYGSPPDSATQARTRRESARALAVSRESHHTPRLWEGAFVRPRESRITSGFGHGRIFNDQVQSRHMGTDFAGAVGTPVVAAGRGVVRLVDEFHLGGGVIYIDHGAGLVTAYLHLSEQGVAEGDTVQAGQPIGRVGATGRVTGPHLHWIVRYGTTTVDPMSLLELDSE